MVNFRPIFQSQISSFFLLHLLLVFRLQISRIFLLNGVKFAIDFSVAKFIICNRFVGRKFQVFIFPFATVILVANFKIFFCIKFAADFLIAKFKIWHQICNRNFLNTLFSWLLQIDCKDSIYDRFCNWYTLSLFFLSLFI